MRNSFPQAILTLAVVGLVLVASSDRASARGGGSRGGSFSRSSVQPSRSFVRSSVTYHPTTFNSFSTFTKNNRGAFPKATFSRPSNLNKGLGLGASTGIHLPNLASSSGKASNLLSNPMSKNLSKPSGKSLFSKNGKYGYGKYDKYGKYGKYGYPWYGWGYPWYGGYGGCDDGSCYDPGSCGDGGPSYGDATSAYQPSDPAGDAPSDPAERATVAPATVAPATVLIVNPAENQSTLAYAINGQPFTLQAGASQPLDATPEMTIEFDRGLSAGTARYPLTAGTYTFASTDEGWDLVSGSPSAAPTPGLAASAPQN